MISVSVKKNITPATDFKILKVIRPVIITVIASNLSIVSTPKLS